ncbi:helix-turn-helix domain-containing protein [Prosthecobacter sp.]|uniref:helix-turn-helix domain-containing protein n=1 Tax=Prosthecobacter sp. TaxID=1965333 RepID=UPI002487CA11|nr:helix-turn-helix domain-containing protein [Prosthecobacter sp.]MDI1315370.1 helix-turn-helix domain-containing protein [Prosthecobacter sp.]
MNHSSPIPQASASSLPAGKITRKQLASYCGLCVRSIDELTRSGVLGHYRIGKSVRYDLAEVEATLRQRFHVQPTTPAILNASSVSGVPLNTISDHKIAATAVLHPALTQPQLQA